MDLVHLVKLVPQVMTSLDITTRLEAADGLVGRVVCFDCGHLLITVIANTKKIVIIDACLKFEVRITKHNWSAQCQ